MGEIAYGNGKHKDSHGGTGTAAPPQPIDEYVGGIQAKIDALRKDGTDQVVEIQSSMDSLKRDRIYTQQEKEAKLTQLKADLEKAKAVESQNKGEVDKLIAEAESYLNSHFGEYYQAVVESGKAEKVQAQEKYQAAVAQLNKEHQETMAKLSDQQEIKDEKYVYKNRLFDAKMDLNKDLQEIKDRQHAAFDHKYHLIDMLRMSKFTFAETVAQRWENYKYTFNRRDFLLKNGLYIAIIIIFIGLCIATPILKGGTQLLTMNNVLNILQQASPRMFLALGVAGLILLAGTDLSIGRMVGMGMTAATIVMHQGPNTGGVFGHIFDFSTMPVLVRVLLALVVCIVLCTVFTTIAGFFTAKFKMHPFISTMANMLVIFGLVTYSTKGVSFGAIDPSIPGMIIPRFNGFPTIILWLRWSWCGSSGTRPPSARTCSPWAAIPRPRRSPVSLYSGSPWAPSCWLVSCTASAPGWSASAWWVPAPPLTVRAGRWTPSPPAWWAVSPSPAVSVRFRAWSWACSSSPL